MNRHIAYYKALEASAHRELLATLATNPTTNKSLNIEILARWIESEYNYGPNAETGAFQAHLDERRIHPSSLQLQDIINAILANPELAHLITPAKGKYVRPSANPWLEEHLHLGRRASVLEYEPEQAILWQQEARTIHAQRKGKNNDE